MRTIKFRGKTTANGHWVYGSLIDYGDNTFAIHNSKSQPWVQAESVGQFTGLRDRNGKEIYEGDIVRWKNKLYAVKFWNGMFYASVHEFNKKMLGGYPLHALTATANKNDECETIGNIHEQSKS